MPGSIDVVIVNWNTGGCLRACLDSIVRSEPVEIGRVTVVDNASSDGSAANLDELPLPIAVIRNDQNIGFAAACNQGAASAASDYLLFLNPDTSLLPSTLITAIRFMDSPAASHIGICGVQVLDKEGRPAISCARFPTLRIIFGKMTRLDRLMPRYFPSHHLTPSETCESRAVDQVIGAFFLVRRGLFARLGGFDESYFLYYEEVDFARRARNAAAGSYFLKDARVFHEGEVSSSQNLEKRLYHSLTSRQVYADTHWAHWQARLLMAFTFGLELPARIVHATAERDRARRAAAVAVYRPLVRDMRRVRPRLRGDRFAGRSSHDRSKSVPDATDAS
jgi:N-acetylglucosaminyl-diphospho-decaprenol L-rhamnosyltransferase